MIFKVNSLVKLKQFMELPLNNSKSSTFFLS